MAGSLAAVEATLKRIAKLKGVHGIIVVNAEGTPIRSDLDNSTTLLIATQCRNLATMANSTVRDLDPRNGLTILRVRTKKNELIIAPHQDYLLIVVQNNFE